MARTRWLWISLASLVLLVGMAGGFWGIGTLMRAAYALTL